MQITQYITLKLLDTSFHTIVLITYGYKYLLCIKELEERLATYTERKHIAHHQPKLVRFSQQRKSTSNQLAALTFNKVFN